MSGCVVTKQDLHGSLGSASEECGFGINVVENFQPTSWFSTGKTKKAILMRIIIKFVEYLLCPRYTCGTNITSFCPHTTLEGRSYYLHFADGIKSREVRRLVKSHAKFVEKPGFNSRWYV